MIILPDRSMSSGRILMPVRKAEWRTPSQAQPKDQFGFENRTRFRLRARLNDGHVVWTGWFDDRDDADAFLWSLASQTLRYDRALWELPTPAWHPGIGENLYYEIHAVTVLTSGAGSTQNWTCPADWNNTGATLELLGPGGNGAKGNYVSTTGQGGGGASGGTYTKVTSLAFSPGTVYSYLIGAGGSQAATTFNSGAITAPGGLNVSSGMTGAAAPAAGVGGSVTNKGGAGGSGASGGSYTYGGGGGGGGGGGPHGAGNNGSNGALGGTANGGAGDAGSGGAANSGAGNLWGSSGPGGGGMGSNNTAGGDGGPYGAGGGGGGSTSASQNGGNGTQGAAAYVYTPSLANHARSFFAMY